jgi:hypothetical protein
VAVVEEMELGLKAVLQVEVPVILAALVVTLRLLEVGAGALLEVRLTVGLLAALAAKRLTSTDSPLLGLALAQLMELFRKEASWH